MKIELLKPHTHAGRDYQAGSQIELDKGAAEWLIAINAAVSYQPSAVSKNAARPHKPTES